MTTHKQQIPPENQKIPVGISACVAGQSVRYDGSHQRDRYVMQTLAAHFEYKPLCPEVGIGLGKAGRPRPVIRLVGDPDSNRAIVRDNDQRDISDALSAYADKALPTLGPLSGFILKSKSPSCGMKAVKVYPSKENSPSSKTGVGKFAQRLMQLNPLLPVEEEGRLNDAVLRENFVERVFAYHEWRQIATPQMRARDLVDFHSRYKFSVMAHSYQRYKELGQLVAGVTANTLAEISQDYIALFMDTLAIHPKRPSQSNALFHLMGYLKRDLQSEERHELVDLINKYRDGVVPLVVPMTFLHHFFKRFPNHYIAQQRYLMPYPEQLALRNVVMP